VSLSTFFVKKSGAAGVLPIIFLTPPVPCLLLEVESAPHPTFHLLMHAYHIMKMNINRWIRRVAMITIVIAIVIFEHIHVVRKGNAID
jgi:hypothetical protein